MIIAYFLDKGMVTLEVLMRVANRLLKFKDSMPEVEACLRNGLFLGVTVRTRSSQFLIAPMDSLEENMGNIRSCLKMMRTKKDIPHVFSKDEALTTCALLDKINKVMREHHANPLTERYWVEDEYVEGEKGWILDTGLRTVVLADVSTDKAKIRRILSKRT